MVGQPTVHLEDGHPRGARGLDPTRLLAERKIIIIRLSKGDIGPVNTRIFGSLVIDWLWQAAQGVPRIKRRPFLFFIDEFPVFLNTDEIEEILAQARKFLFGVVLVNQSLGAQLTKSQRHAVIGNTWSKGVFRIDPDDAKALAEVFQPHLSPDDFVNLNPRELYLRIPVGDDQPPPVSVRTLDRPEPTGSAEAARDASRKRYSEHQSVVRAAALGAPRVPVASVDDGELPKLPTAYDLITEDHDLDMGDVLPGIAGWEVEE